MSDSDELSDFDRITREEERAIRDAHDQALKCQQEVMTFLTQCGIFSKVYALRSRTKDRRAILQKIERKREDNPGYSLESMTDLLGIRFIALYREDVLDLIDEVCRILSGDHPVRPCPFLENQVEEFKVYTTTVKGDTSNISGRVEKLVSDRFQGRVRVEVHERATYSSIHIITRLTAKAGKLHIPAELQLRSVFEDAWGEIDHKLRYGQTRAAFEDALAIPSSFETHLRHLKSFLDAAAGYADTIRREVLGSREASNEQTKDRRSIKRDLDSSGYAVQLLGLVGLSVELIAEYDAVLREKAKVDSSKDQFSAGVASEYEKLAEKLFRIYEREKKPGGVLSQETESARYFSYFLRMEEALCLLLTGQSGTINEAILIYHELSAVFANVAALPFRLGQCYSMLGKTDESITQYARCIEMVERPREVSSDDLDLTLPPHHALYLSENLYRMIGYQYWKRAMAPGDRSSAENLQDLLRAYEYTHRRIPGAQPENQYKMHNNCLFYAVETLSYAESHQLAAPPELPRQRDEHLEIVVKSSGGLSSEDPFVLDTVATALKSRGEMDLARQYAKRVLDVLLSPNSPVQPSSPGDPLGSGRRIEREDYEAKTAMIKRAWNIVNVKDV